MFILGWYAVERFCLMLRIWQMSWVNLFANWGGWQGWRTWCPMAVKVVCGSVRPLMQAVVMFCSLGRPCNCLYTCEHHMINWAKRRFAWPGFVYHSIQGVPWEESYGGFIVSHLEECCPLEHIVMTFPYSKLLRYLFYSSLRPDCSLLISYDILTVLSVSLAADFPFIDFLLQLLILTHHLWYLISDLLGLCARPISI